MFIGERWYCPESTLRAFNAFNQGFCVVAKTEVEGHYLGLLSLGSIKQKVQRKHYNFPFLIISHRAGETNEGDSG